MKGNFRGEMNKNFLNSSEENPILKANLQKPFFLKFFYLLCSKKDILLIILGIIASLGLGSFPPIFTVIVGEGINRLGPHNTEPEVLNAFDITSWALLILGASVSILNVLHIWIWTIIWKRLSIAFKEDYFELIFKQDQKWFDQETRYKLNTKVQQQMYLVEETLRERFANLFNSTSLFVTSIIMVFRTSWKLAIVLIGFAPLLTIASYFMDLEVARNSLKLKKNLSKSGSVVEELLFKMRTVSAFTNFEYETRRYHEKLKIAINYTLKKFFWVSISYGVYQLVLWSIISLGVWYGSILIARYDLLEGRPIGPGDIAIVISCIRYACLGFTQIYPNYEDIRGATSRNVDYYNLKLQEINKSVVPISEQPISPEEYSNIKGELKMKIKSFRYPVSQTNNQILKDIDLEFRPGQVSVIVGESGSGKSTLFYLIERFYDIENKSEGEIQIDGRDIKLYDKTLLRNVITYIQAEPMLIDISIYKNIVLGKSLEHYSIEDVKKACSKIYADEFINRLDGQYNFLPGPRGELLSLGERQRISIARGIIGKPRILLLDEPTSLLDYENEKKVMKVIESMTKELNLTTIIISHRLSIINKSHRIIAMKKGEIIETGTQKELLEKNGYYSTLVKHLIFQDCYTEHKSRSSSRKQSLLKLEQTSENAHNTMIENNINKMEVSFKDSEESLIHENYEINFERLPTRLKQKDIPERITFWYLIFQHKLYIFIIIFAAVINGSSLAGFAVLSSQAIRTMSSTNAYLVRQAGSNYSLIFLVIGLGTSITYFIKYYYLFKVGELVCEKIKLMMFNKLIRMDMGFYDRKENNPGTLMSYLETETYTLHGGALLVIVEAVQILTCLLVGSLLGLGYGYRTALIILSFFPFIWIAGYYHLKKKKEIDYCEDEADIAAYDYLCQVLINNKIIISSNAQNDAKKIFQSHLHNEEKSKIYCKSFICGLSYGIALFICFVDYTVVLHVSKFFIINKISSVFDILTSLIPVFFTAFTAASLHDLVSTFSRSNICVKDIFLFLEERTKIDPFFKRDKDNLFMPLEELNVKGKISFRSVMFNYTFGNVRNILNNVSFIIQSGEITGFVGFSGCGKSTIISLLLRFYDVNSGEIRIDGINIKDLDLILYRSQISVVLQEPTLFNCTVRENIRYGNLKATNDEIDKIAEMTMTKNILDSDYNSSLSIGEKQKISIARALIREPKILLLDEVTSFLDEDSTANIMNNVLQYVRNKKITCVIVTDELKAIETANKIYFLDEGRIVEKGSHQELMKMKGRYHHLYTQQQKGKK